MGFARSLTMSLESLRVTHGSKTSWSTNQFRSLETETARMMCVINNEHRRQSAALLANYTSITPETDLTPEIKKHDTGLKIPDYFLSEQSSINEIP